MLAGFNISGVGFLVVLAWYSVFGGLVVPGFSSSFTVGSLVGLVVVGWWACWFLLGMGVCFWVVFDAGGWGGWVGEGSWLLVILLKNLMMFLVDLGCCFSFLWLPDVFGLAPNCLVDWLVFVGGWWGEGLVGGVCGWLVSDRIGLFSKKADIAIFCLVPNCLVGWLVFVGGWWGVGLVGGA